MNEKNKSSQWQIRSESSKIPTSQRSPDNEEDINIEFNHRERPYGQIQPHHEGKTEGETKRQKS